MEALTGKSAADPEGYLAHPVNAYKLVKRLNTDWPALGDLVLQDAAAGEGQGAEISCVCVPVCVVSLELSLWVCFKSVLMITSCPFVMFPGNEIF